MSINEMLLKIKPFYNLFLIVIISFIFFILGRISALEERHTPIRIEYAAEQTAAVVSSSAQPKEATLVSISGEVIGSKTSKKYYFPWCGTVKRIKPENQVHFSSIEEAKRAGFIAGGGCKGLK